MDPAGSDRWEAAGMARMHRSGSQLSVWLSHCGSQAGKTQNMPKSVYHHQINTLVLPDSTLQPTLKQKKCTCVSVYVRMCLWVPGHLETAL